MQDAATIEPRITNIATLVPEALKAALALSKSARRGGLPETTAFPGAPAAALALTEAVTRLSDRADPVPDEIWEHAAEHYDERALASLIIEIASINVWNRFNVATRQPAGA